MTPDEIKAQAEALRSKGKSKPARKATTKKAAPAKKAPAKPNSVKTKPKSAKATTKPVKAPVKKQEPAKPEAPEEKPLTEAEEIACQQYIHNGGDQSKAFRFAFPHTQKWKDKTVWSKASVFFSKGKVQERVKQLQEIAAQVAEEKFKVDAEYVLKRHYEIDTMDFLHILDDHGGFKPIKEWPLIFRQFLSGMDVAEIHEGRGDERVVVGILKKIKWPDKMKNLELLGKHKAVCAYREQIGVSDPDGKPLSILTREMSQEEAALAYKELLGRNG